VRALKQIVSIAERQKETKSIQDRAPKSAIGKLKKYLN